MSCLSRSVLSIGLCLTLTGCAATLAEPVYVQAEYVPPRIDAYPHTVYEGEVVYLVDGRWYYRRGPSWFYYHREPDSLRRYRVESYRAPRAYAPRDRYVAPPAPRRYVAPPAHAPRRYVAPPAHPQGEHGDKRRSSRSRTSER